MNDELKDEGIRGKKMLTGKRLVFTIICAVLAGTVIAGIYYYENTYKFRQYSVDVNSDMGKFATKIALDTAINEGYEPNELIPRFIKAQNQGNNVRLWVILSGSDVYKNITLITNHPIKDGEGSILLYEFVEPVEGTEKVPWIPKTATWPANYYTITKQDSIVEASLSGVKMARIINPIIVEMNAEQSKEQIDKLNELAYKYGGTALSYNVNILVLSGVYGPSTGRYDESVEVVMDIEGSNAKIVGIVKRETVNEPKKEGYEISKKSEEAKWYSKPKIVLIKP